MKKDRTIVHESNSQVNPESKPDGLLLRYPNLPRAHVVSNCLVGDHNDLIFQIIQ